MKIYPAIKYLAWAGMLATMGGCASNQVAQTGEYDDLYYSSKDKKEVQYTASTSSDNLKYNDQNQNTVERSQPNANPDYVEPYTAPTKKARESYVDADNSTEADNYSDNSGDTYYDEDYAVNNRNQFGNIRPSTISSSNGTYYSSPANYDPFFDPFYGPTYARNSFYYSPFVGSYCGSTVVYRVSPQVVVSFGTGYGWGSSWYGRRNYYGYGYDPYWGYNSWGYNRGWGDPFYGGGYGYYGGWNGGGWGNNWYNNYYYNNTVVVGNTDRGRTVYRNNGPRTERSTERVVRGGREIQRSGGAEPATAPSRGGRIAGDDANTNRPLRPARTSVYDQSRDDNGRGGRSTTNPEYNSGRPSSENAAPSPGTFERPTRAQRPQGDGNQRRSTYSNESNTRPSQPTYSSPQPQRRTNDNNSNSSPSYSAPRPSRSNDGGSNSGGSYNSGRSSGSSSGGSAPSRSSSGGGSSSGSSRPPRR